MYKKQYQKKDGQYLTQSELAGILKVSLRTVQTLAAEGMPCFYVGARPRYDVKKVQAWLESRSGKGARA
ncbi:helix-turn-helix domain-containing protein [uncultured Akkermansia sp.]|uniref:helix-turn-helix domain-containing protein n=1 Tax=uncultured Akkermansia sp. TaxID=512294 RepID=UPI002627AF91|nr:helix-turn-helix domain-containing protein [uncultured Akkermansia sp.]